MGYRRKMKTAETFQQFYQERLLPDMEALEKKRKQIVANIMRDGLVAAIAIFVILMFFRRFFFVGFIAIAVFAVRCHFHAKGYDRMFRTCVIEKIVHFIDEHLSYFPNRGVPESVYLKSRIFLQKPDRYRGDNLVRGIVGQTEIAFSQIHSECKEESEDRDGKRETTWQTIFRGLFFLAGFNKDFKGHTLVLPDMAQKIFGEVLGSLFQSWNFTRGELVKLEDPEFERFFVVYGTDQIEARYILSASLMKRITDFRKKTGKAICLSFMDKRVFVAIPYKETLFEPRLFRKTTSRESIRKYYDDLRLAVGIVRDLDLNTRIWSETGERG